MNHLQLFALRVAAVLGIALCLAFATAPQDQLAMLVSVLATGSVVGVFFALLLGERMNAARLNYWDAALATSVLAVLFGLLIEVPALPAG